MVNTGYAIIQACLSMLTNQSSDLSIFSSIVGFVGSLLTLQRVVYLLCSGGLDPHHTNIYISLDGAQMTVASRSK